MNIVYKTGSLMEAAEPVICHGCNARGVMGSGIAKIVREVYPRAYQAYRDVYTMQDERLDLGQVITADCGRHVVANAITQETYGKDPDTVYVSYWAIEEIVMKLDRVAVLSGTHEFAGFFRSPIGQIAFPLIGAGLARGSWSRISQIIENRSVHFEPVVYLLDGVVPQS